MRLPAWRHPRNLTIQARIVLLVIACILPASLLVAFVTYLSYERERSNIGQHTLATTRELMRVVERVLGANEAAMQTLSHSVDIDRGDFADFYGEAKEVLRYTSGFTIVLTDASAQQVVNLLQPFGSPLPRHGNPELLRRVLDTHKPVVSDLFIGGVTGKPLLAVEVPVIRDGKARYGLAVGIYPDHLGYILKQQGLPPEWVVSIFDSTGTIVARTHAAERYVGQKGSPALMRAMLQAQEGMLDTPTLEGIPVMAAFSRSPAYGWTVAIGVPEAILTTELSRLLGLYAVGGSLLLLAGLGMAIVIGRSITRPIQTLIAPALDIGKGKSVSIPRLDLKEADEVRQALLKAQLLLVQREEERDQAERSERQMQLAKEVAEQSNKAKAAFLANMSHELRTPLNAILGFSRLMRNATDVTVEQMRNLDIINRSGEYLLHLINSVLDIAKIESGHVALQENEFDLHQLLHEIRSLMQVQAAEKSLGFTVVIAPDLPRYVGADSGKLRQVLINLLGNAIKFTRDGGVVLRTTVANPESPQRARIRFEVEDTGPGIREEDMKCLFSPFESSGDTTMADAGTGLGLAISKQYVELMGGGIGVATQPGKGSVFHFEIPVRIVTRLEETSAPSRYGHVAALAPGQQQYRLLIAEDQPENRLLLRKLLEPVGFEVREAANGREAVALAEKWHPDLIWMDIRMPEMDGLETTRRIKASQTTTRTKIIALTAHALEEERQAILAAGCDDFIRKPYRDVEIFEALAKHLGVRFLYLEDQAPADAVDAGELDAAQLAKLPPSLLEDLRHAAVLLDGQRCRDIAGRIGAIDNELGARLHRMIANFLYQELLELLDQSIGARSA